MANLHLKFKTFHDEIELPESKRKTLEQARDALRDRIRKHFREKLGCSEPQFKVQGSCAMNTVTNPLDGEYDIDDGVYLMHLDGQTDKDWPTPETVHDWLVAATEGHTKDKPMDKRTCVRVRYAGDYHVDLPAYARLRGEYQLAEKGPKGWHKSEPDTLTQWFEDQIRMKGEQLRRIVRYLKAWADFQQGRRGTMPSGLILTVLASQSFQASGRDDEALAQTTKAMAPAIAMAVVVMHPVDGDEDFCARLSPQEKKRFQEAIKDLAHDAATALAAVKSSAASKIWRNQFGDRFPLITDEEEKDHTDRKADIATLVQIQAGKNPTKPWCRIR